MKTIMAALREYGLFFVIGLLRCNEQVELMVGKVKSAYEPIVAHHPGAYPSFHSMKRLGVFLLPPEWDASPSQGYPQQ